MGYRLLVLLHLFGVIAFSSNAVAAFFWQGRATASGDARVVAHAFATLMKGDRWITPLSTVAILASGLGLSSAAGLSLLGTGWILWSMAAFAASGLVFVARVLPLQRRLAAWTAAAENLDWPRYRRESRRWSHWAHASLGLALVAVAIMVLRPSLPAF